MNIKTFSIAVLISALPLVASAGVAFDRGDFIAAEKATASGEFVVKVRLSKSGKAKMKRIQKSNGQETALVGIDGIEREFNVRTPVPENEVEMGPYSSTEADRVVNAINTK